MKEFVLWGTKKGNEAWQEELITTAPVSEAGKEKLDKAKLWAKKQGFEHLRVSTNDSDVAPNFPETLKR